LSRGSLSNSFSNSGSATSRPNLERVCVYVCVCVSRGVKGARKGQDGGQKRGIGSEQRVVIRPSHLAMAHNAPEQPLVISPLTGPPPRPTQPGQGSISSLCGHHVEMDTSSLDQRTNGAQLRHTQIYAHTCRCRQTHTHIYTCSTSQTSQPEKYT
jgi:hypothetical protein